MQAAKTSHVRSVAAPLIMYGTAWKEDRTQALVLEAIAAGFRAFDTANQRKHYVEGEVGAAVRAAIASGTVTREDLFLQTKFTYQHGQDYRLPYDPDCDLTTRRCQINLRRAAGTRSRMRIHAAATAFRHSLAASARKIRSVDRETRWR
jgi:diketogulonate reductase-like aldo/keto reductase